MKVLVLCSLPAIGWQRELPQQSWKDRRAIPRFSAFGLFLSTTTWHLLFQTLTLLTAVSKVVTLKTLIDLEGIHSWHCQFLGFEFGSMIFLFLLVNCRWQCEGSACYKGLWLDSCWSKGLCSRSSSMLFFPLPLPKRETVWCSEIGR